MQGQKKFCPCNLKQIGKGVEGDDNQALAKIL
jgi:hypothetical protein